MSFETIAGARALVGFRAPVGFALLAGACAGSASPHDGALLRLPAGPDAEPTSTVARPATSTMPPKLPTDLTGSSQVVCGESTCTTPTEVCCLGLKEVCVERQPVDASHFFGEWGATFDVCQRASEYARADVVACDDSGDCEDGGVCCESPLGFEGISIRRCEPAGTICPIAERCHGQSECRTPGTACVDESCKRASGTTVCGASTCTLPGEVCCGEGDVYACRPRAACAWTLECAQPADCPQGQSCAMSGSSRSWCVAGPDASTLTIACDTEADCPKLSICLRMACVPGGPRKVCECVTR